MFGYLYKRFPWLGPKHPLVAREQRRVNHELPRLIRKMTDPWTTLGYAALIHGAMFMVSLIGYGRLFPGMPIILMPFLTPFGTPLAAAMLHSVLYWAMLIGVCNYTTFLVGHDVETRTWNILQTTPYPAYALLGAKLSVVARMWTRVLRMLLLTRALALLVLPTAIYLQQQGAETRPFGSADFLSAAVFLAQPFVDAFLIASLSVVSALAIRNSMWSKVGAYGLIAIVYGGLSVLGSFWLIFRSPLGALAGLLVPLSHWAPLVSAVVRPISQAEYGQRGLAVAGIYFVLPLFIGIFGLIFAHQLARRIE